MSGTQPENDGIIPQKSLTVWDGMGKTRNVQKRESVDIKRSGNMEERRESYNNKLSSPVSRTESLETQCFKVFLFSGAYGFSSLLIVRKILLI
jgi:hypothetical protein